MSSADQLAAEPAAARAPEGAEWFVTVEHPYRASFGPLVLTLWPDGRRLASYEDAVAFGSTMLEGEQFTADRSRVTVGWRVPLRHSDGQV